MPYLTVGGHKLYYEWRGEHDPARDAVIFLHHGLGAVGSWKDLPDRIAEATGLNALVYDRLGYGLSDARMDFPHGFMEAEVLLLLEELPHYWNAQKLLLQIVEDGAAEELVELEELEKVAQGAAEGPA